MQQPAATCNSRRPLTDRGALWPTAEEAALAAYEQERFQKEVALEEKEALLKRVAELEAKVGRRDP